jgi:hypothetical protein
MPRIIPPIRRDSMRLSDKCMVFPAYASFEAGCVKT